MVKVIDYKRSSNKGGIIVHESGTHTAVTAVSSKDFKTLNGAEKYMEKFKYEKVVL